MTTSELTTAAMGAAVTIGSFGSGYLVWWSKRKADRTKAADAAAQKIQAAAKAEADARVASWPGLNDGLYEEIQRLRADVAEFRKVVADLERQLAAMERRTVALERDLDVAQRKIRQLENKS